MSNSRSVPSFHSTRPPHAATLPRARAVQPKQADATPPHAATLMRVAQSKRAMGIRPPHSPYSPHAATLAAGGVAQRAEKQTGKRGEKYGDAGSGYSASQQERARAATGGISAHGSRPGGADHGENDNTKREREAYVEKLKEIKVSDKVEAKAAKATAKTLREQPAYIAPVSHPYGTVKKAKAPKNKHKEWHQKHEHERCQECGRTGNGNWL